MKSLHALALSILTLVYFASPAFAAVDMFFKISGVPGESTDMEHPGEIEIERWSLIVPGSGDPGRRGRKRNKDPGTISITKFIDSTSSGFYRECCSGKHFPEAKLTVRKAGGAPDAEYLVIFFRTLSISQIETGGVSDENLQPLESITFTFQEMEVVYREQKEDGTIGREFEHGWDIKKSFKK